MPKTTKEITEKENKKLGSKASSSSTKKTTTSKTSSTSKASNTKSKTSTKTTKKSSVASKKESNKKTTTKSTVASKKETAKKSTSKSKSSASKSTKKTVSTTKKATSKKSPSKKIVNKKVDILEYYDLPYRYNKTIVKVLAQTPKTLFVYWDISDNDRENYIKQYGENFFNITRPVLIIYNDTMNYSFEIPINDFANSWYINVTDANCKYKVELSRKKINYIET